MIAHRKLHGLDESRVLAAVVPILRAHGVEGVELVWRTDQGGWVLELTIERPDSTVPGAGITIDLCSEISRDLSAALDVAEVIPNRYRLEVGSPGLDRSLYSRRDYERFAGQLTKLKLKQPISSEHVLRGRLQGVDEHGSVLVETERGIVQVPFETIASARLVIDLGESVGSRTKGRKSKNGASGRSSGAPRTRNARG